MSTDTGGRTLGVTGGGGGRKSWAELLGSSLPSSQNKNILEVCLDKDERGAFVVSDTDCARMMRKLGLDPHPGIHVEGVQICPNGRGVILLTLKENVQAENFCRHDIFEVTQSGIRSTLVKPAGKREVVVNMKGIHPNTMDNVVLDYLSKFGRVVTTKVVYGVFSEGPLKGMKNGDRAYKLEVKPGENIGSYHTIDCQKVSLRYAGQQQTCGRCHETPQKCRGRGLAKKCEAEGGTRIEFTDYILGLWKRIGYTPAGGDSARDISAEYAPESEQLGGHLTRVKVPTGDQEKYAGVCIKQFQKDTDHGEIVEFLCKNGLPAEKKDGIIIKANGIVNIRNLDNDTCKAIIEAIHGKVNLGRKLFCNGIIPLTPEKEIQTVEIQENVFVSAPPGTPSTLGAGPPPSVDQTGPQFQPSRPEMFNIPAHTSTSELVRRHSISLMDRIPPTGSLADELLGIQSARSGLLKTKSMLNDLKDMTDKLSDFGSCMSFSDSSGEGSGEDNTENGGYKSLNEKRRNKKKKRKLKLTPGKEDFMKKPHLVQ